MKKSTIFTALVFLLLFFGGVCTLGYVKYRNEHHSPAHRLVELGADIEMEWQPILFNFTYQAKITSVYCSNRSKLKASENAEIIQILKRCESLEDLSIRTSFFSKRDTDLCSNFTRLKYLSIRFDGGNVSINDIVKSTRGLKSIELYSAPGFSSEIDLSMLGANPDLDTLHLEKLTLKNPESLQRFNNLLLLYVNGCNHQEGCESKSTRFLEFVKSCTSLQGLSLHFQTPRPISLRPIRDLKELRVLEFGGGRIRDLEVVLGLPKLDTLRFYDQSGGVVRKLSDYFVEKIISKRSGFELELSGRIEIRRESLKRLRDNLGANFTDTWARYVHPKDKNSLESKE